MSVDKALYVKELEVEWIPYTEFVAPQFVHKLSMSYISYKMTRFRYLTFQQKKQWHDQM
jgi:hypothetical protein